MSNIWNTRQLYIKIPTDKFNGEEHTQLLYQSFRMQSLQALGRVTRLGFLRNVWRCSYSQLMKMYLGIVDGITFTYGIEFKTDQVFFSLHVYNLKLFRCTFSTPLLY